jgi:ATP-binding cassette subfamily C protein LapB
MENSAPPAVAWPLAAVDSQRPEDPLLDCLIFLARLHQRPKSAQALTAGLPLQDGCLTPALFVRSAERAGINARLVRRPLDAISDALLPVVLLLHERRAVVLLGWQADGAARIADPQTGMGEEVWPRQQLLDQYAGSALLVRPAPVFDERSADHGALHSGHWFWGTLRKLWPIYGEVLLAAFLVNLFALALPLFTMNVYNRVVPNRAVETLWVLAIGVAVVALFDLLMRSLRAYFLDVAGKKFDVALSARLFEQVMGLRMEARPRSVGAFANQLSEFESFREFITSATLTTLIDLPFALLFLAVIAWIGGPLVVVPLVLMPVVILYGWWAQVRLRDLVQQSMRLASQKQATLVETLTGFETLRSVGAAGPIQRRWEQVVGSMARLGMRSRLLSASVINVAGLAVQLSSLGILVYGVHRIIEGELSVGGLIACVMLAGRALAPLGQVAGLLVRFDQSMAALRSVNQIMQLPVERPPERNFLHRPVLQGAIEFSNVSFRYPGQQIAALDNVSLKIAPGERVAVIGRIGSGKSTLEKLILGLYEPTAGAVLLDGIDLRQIDPADVRRNIGYVPQDVTLFFGSLRDNIALAAPQADDETVLRAAELAGVMSFVSRHPAGLEQQIGERGEGLSGGQRQAVAIARGLLLEPPVLIMDEPTNAMDNSSEEQFKNRLLPLLDGRTLLLVTHRASLLSLVGRVIVMDGGRIVADGPKEQVLEALRGGRLTGRPA